MLKILSIKKIKTSLLGCNRYTKYHIYFMYIILWAWIYAYTHKTITTIKVINISVTTKSFLGTCLVVRMLCYAKSIQSCPTPCDPIDGSPPGCAVPGIPQARTVEWVAISFSNAGKWKVKVKSLSRVRLFATPLDYSLPGSSIHGIFQARVLEWDAIAFSTREL